MEKVLSPLDAVFHRGESEGHLMTCAGLYHFTKKITDPSEIKVSVNEYVSFPNQLRMRQIVKSNADSWFGRPSFVNDNDFSIDNHFRIQKIKTTQELPKVLSEILSSKFDFTRPLWECIWIETTDDDENSMFLLRAHHCISDGQGFVRGLLAYVASRDPTLSTSDLQYNTGRHVTNEKNGKQSQTPTNTNSTTKKNASKTALEYFTHAMGMIWFWIFGSLVALFNFIKLSIFWRKSLTDCDRTIRKQVGWSSKVTLDEVKRIKNHYKISVNDVLVSALSSAIEGYLKSKEALKDDSFWYLIPASLRHPSDWSVTNQTSGYSLNVPVTGDNHVERMMTTNRRMKTLKSSLEPVWTAFFMKVIFYFPYLIPEFLFEHNCVSKMLAVLTNVPGPSKPIRWSGEVVDNVVVFVPQIKYNGLGCGIYTYNNKVTVSVVMSEIDNHDACQSGAAQEIADRFTDTFYEILKDIQKNN